MLGSAGRAVGREPPARLPDADERTYFELEFAVGFPAEEETLL